MRDFLNGILTFIGASSLTDEEFETATSELPLYDQSTYDDLSSILKSREMVSTYLDRLNAYYKAKGVSISEANNGKSNILLGGKLEY